MKWLIDATNNCHYRLILFHIALYDIKTDVSTILIIAYWKTGLDLSMNDQTALAFLNLSMQKLNSIEMTSDLILQLTPC